MSLATTKERTIDDQMTHRTGSEKVVAEGVGELGHQKEETIVNQRTHRARSEKVVAEGVGELGNHKGEDNR